MFNSCKYYTSEHHVQCLSVRSYSEGWEELSGQVKLLLAASAKNVANLGHINIFEALFHKSGSAWQTSKYISSNINSFSPLYSQKVSLGVQNMLSLYYPRLTKCLLCKLGTMHNQQGTGSRAFLSCVNRRQSCFFVFGTLIPSLHNTMIHLCLFVNDTFTSFLVLKLYNYCR